MVVWIIGLSASGKTTLARALYGLMQQYRPNTVLLDGDMVREIMGQDLGHSIEDRWRNAQRISRLCLQLERQGINVVAAVLSVFHESQRWNRDHFQGYREIYIEASKETLRRRETKDLYARADRGELTDVVGVDIPFVPPPNPDLTFDNNRDGLDMHRAAVEIATKLRLDLGIQYPYSADSLLDRREKYQYSAYLGPGFLDAYERRRTETLHWLTVRIQRLEELTDARESHPVAEALGLSGKAGAFLLETIPIERRTMQSDPHVLRTESYLVDALIEATHMGRITNEDLLIRLLGRFEVSKRLHGEYTLPDLRRTRRSGRQPALYALMALCLEAACSWAAPERRLVLLNAVLKLNDLLDSIRDSLATPAEYYLVKSSLDTELRLISQLRKRTQS